MSLPMMMALQSGQISAFRMCSKLLQIVESLLPANSSNLENQGCR